MKVDFSGITQSIKNVYGWKVENEAPVLEMDLPSFVTERVEYFREESENGLSFMGYMNAVMGYDQMEKENKETFHLFGSVDWLTPSKEFKKWRDEYLFMRELEIAVAIIYGRYTEEVKEESKND